jgi:hypothetical protein
MAALRLFALMKVSIVDISTFKFGIGSDAGGSEANLNDGSSTGRIRNRERRQRGRPSSEMASDGAGWRTLLTLVVLRMKIAQEICTVARYPMTSSRMRPGSLAWAIIVWERGQLQRYLDQRVDTTEVPIRFSVSQVDPVLSSPLWNKKQDVRSVALRKEWGWLNLGIVAPPTEKNESRLLVSGPERETDTETQRQSEWVSERLIERGHIS